MMWVLVNSLVCKVSYLTDWLQNVNKSGLSTYYIATCSTSLHFFASRPPTYCTFLPYDIFTRQYIAIKYKIYLTNKNEFLDQGTIHYIAKKAENIPCH